MIGLGLRLVINGGREAVIRLLVLAAAVGLGVGLLLAAVAATNAAVTWNNRHAWFWTGTASVPPEPAAAGIAPLWWHPGGDTFDGQTISRFDAAATGASSPVPPGITHDPGPGQYYASPALAALLRSTPADQLADRYPGRLVGTISDVALPSPDSLVIIIGRTPAQLAGTPNSVQVTSIATAVPGNFGGQANPTGLDYIPPDPGGEQSAVDLLLSVIALAILAPVLIFIATATRLSAARREQRFAAMRLVGATRKQVSLLAATESTAAAVLGMAAGFGIFFLLRTPVAGIPFIGQPFFPAELSLSPPDILAVAIGVPVAAAVAARLALRRMRISPLGVARRLADDPRAAFRAVSGLVLALFITTVAVAVITTWNAQQLTLRISAAETNVLTDQQADQQPSSASQASTGPAAPAAPLAAELNGIHGVHGVVVVRADPGLTIPATLLGTIPYPGARLQPTPAGVVSCAQLAAVPALGRCPPGATAAAFPADGFAGPLYDVDATGITWPAANVQATRLDSLAVDAINVATNGTVPAVEQARTVLENAPAYPAYLGDGAPSTVGELIAQSNPTNCGYQQLAYYLLTAGGILAALGIIAATFPLLARITGPEVARNE